jgi:hypothetical protein
MKPEAEKNKVPTKKKRVETKRKKWLERQRDF